jgi:AraC-like DNA-binding protein
MIASIMVQALIIEGWMAQILGLLLIAALLSRRGDYSIANRLLAFGIFCAIYRQAILTLQLSGTLEDFPILAKTAFSVQMLGIPTFWLYVRALTVPDFRFESKHAVHLIPFAIGLALTGQPHSLQIAVKVIAVLPYLVLAHIQVRFFAIQSRDFMSDLTLLHLDWLRTLLIGVYSIMAIDVLDVVTGASVPVWRLLPSVALIGLMALAYLSLRVSPIFERETADRRPVLEDRKEVASEDTHIKEAIRPPDELLERQKSRLIEVMEKERLYLNPELRLSDLAQAMDVRPYRVSEILNRGLQTTFYDLVNRYRISRAQELLLAPDVAHFNVLGIAMESGFKSKSVFNDVFKKSTGKTPSQFRDEIRTESAHSDA